MRNKEIECLMFKANELRTQRRYKEALNIYNKAITKWGEDADILAVAAQCSFDYMGSSPDPEYYAAESVRLMQRAVAAESTNANLHARLADLYWLAILDYDSAAKEYRKAIELNSRNADVLFSAAGLYGEPSEVVSLDEATTWLETAVAINPDKPMYYIRLGHLYEDSGRNQKAKEAWTKALLCSTPVAAELAKRIGKLLCKS